jgi:RNA polymerase sigma-70 factor (ECF subfamily)
MDEATAVRPPQRATDAPEQSHKVENSSQPCVADIDALVASHGRQIARLVSRLVDRVEDVEDLVQETFLAALTHRRTFRGKCRPATWLARIAVNKCRSHHRWRRLRRFIPLPTSPATTAQDDSLETEEEVRRAVQRLPAKYREVIVLRYFEDMSIDQLIEVLGLRRTTVDKRLSRAREKLKETLTPRLDS